MLHFYSLILNIVHFVLKTQLVSTFRQFLPLFTKIYRGAEIAVNEYVNKSCSQSDRVNPWHSFVK